MSSGTRLLGYVLALHMEAVVLIVVAWWVGTLLDKRWPMTWPWLLVTFPLALVMVGRGVLNVIRLARDVGKGDGPPAAPKDNH